MLLSGHHAAVDIDSWNDTKGDRDGVAVWARNEVNKPPPRCSGYAPT
jgi:ABC-type branched-subunit amino acid transport system substrate-binding protein